MKKLKNGKEFNKITMIMFSFLNMLHQRRFRTLNASVLFV